MGVKPAAVACVVVDVLTTVEVVVVVSISVSVSVAVPVIVSRMGELIMWSRGIVVEYFTGCCRGYCISVGRGSDSVCCSRSVCHC